MEIIIENVRSFCDRHSVPIRPLTLLVGENSTGKSTFLSAVAHVLSFVFPSTRPSFNVAPFDLGSYDSIATYKGGRYGRASSFSIGFVEDSPRGRREVVSTYRSQRGQPQLSSLVASGAEGEVVVSISPELRAVKVSGKTSAGQSAEVEVDMGGTLPGIRDIPVGYLAHVAMQEAAKKKGDEREALVPAPLISLLRLLNPPRDSSFAMAPVRTKPKRTYDEFSDEFDPEGDHIPVILARLWQEEDSGRKQRLISELNEFGRAGSLYKQISVRRLGRHPNDPFQILVRMGGPPANLADVGYGVSQALPVVVQSILAEGGGTLLLQQPEVHLHPRSQAALGSFFARLVSAEQKRLIVETHSDYLLDRIRLEVSSGKLHADKVLILFFERTGLETTLYQLHLDRNGNVLDSPPSYRRFFLEEELSLFSRAGE